MSRGFKLVDVAHQEYGVVVTAHGTKQMVFPQERLPERSDPGSAGYDFFSPINTVINPGDQKVIWTNVKAYMEADEVLQLYPRSSMGIKNKITLANTVGIIDASYYSNPNNDGNIGICLRNNSGQGYEVSVGDKIAQGIFTKFLIVEDDNSIGERTGGIGSSGR